MMVMHCNFMIGRRWYECKRKTVPYVICLCDNSKSGKGNGGGTELKAVPVKLSTITVK